MHTNHSGRRPAARPFHPRFAYRTFAALAVAGLPLGLLSPPLASDAAAALSAETRCARALTNAHRRVLTRHATLLARCVQSIEDGRSPRSVTSRCGRLATADLGTDRIESGARARVLSHCREDTLPLWLGDRCSADGPSRNAAVADPQSAAGCALASGRCMGARAVADLIETAVDAVNTGAPNVWLHEQAGIPGATLGACFEPAMGSTTTLPAPTTTTTSTTTLPGVTTTSTTLPEPSAPSIVITELMPDPSAQSDSAGEYFEIRNLGSAALDLMGWTFRDLGSNTFTVSDPVVVAPGAYAVLGRSAEAADGAVDYVYGSAMSLGNSEDEVIAEKDGVVFDQVIYDASFPIAAGAAMELAVSMETPAGNDSAAAWCPATAVLASGDTGTPGRGADCPTP